VLVLTEGQAGRERNQSNSEDPLYILEGGSIARQETTLTHRPTHFDVADRDIRLNDSLVDIDAQTGRAVGIRRIVINEAEARRLAR
jgi:hypothetical protein